MIVLTYCSTLCIFKLKFKAIYIKLDYFINELSKILCEERILILSIHPYNFSFFVALMIELSERFFSGILSHLKSPTWLAPWNDTRNLTIWNYFLFVLNSSSDFSRCRPTWRAQLSTRSSRPRGNRWGSISPPPSVGKRVASALAKPRNEACPLGRPAAPPTAPWPCSLSAPTVRKRYNCH